MTLAETPLPLPDPKRTPTQAGRRLLARSAGALCAAWLTALLSLPAGAYVPMFPANDLCIDAIPVPVDSTVPGATMGATTDSDKPSPCGELDLITSPGVWYTVVGTGNVLSASTCDAADFDTKISVYCQDCDALTCVDGNDDGPGCAGFTSFLEWDSLLDVTYRILVHGFGGQEGNFELTVLDTGIPSEAAVACAAPALLLATKVDSLGDDVYEDGNFSPGDTVHYVVEISNAGGDAEDAVYADLLDPKTTLVVGSVTTTQGVVTSGNGPGDMSVQVDVGVVAAAGSVTIEYDAVIDDPLSEEDIEAGLSNQGDISGSNFDPLVTDDPDQPGDMDPTTTPLADICEGVEPTDGCRVNGGLGACQGTPGDDVIIGTGGNDRILGKGGSDNIVGLEGRDLICCGGGADFCYGDDGRDRIDGGGGGDLLDGARGNDTITGGRGNDTIKGRDGRDRLDGGPGGQDVIDGGLGSDNCTDPDGATFISCGPSCGLGFELVFLLAPLWWLRGRRRGGSV